jgi:membrane-bound serine protease (ClpP class)
MVGAIGRTVRWEDGAGWVHVFGENWRAVGPDDLAADRRVRVEGKDGLTLTVAPLDEHEETS